MEPHRYSVLPWKQGPSPLYLITGKWSLSVNSQLCYIHPSGTFDNWLRIMHFRISLPIHSLKQLSSAPKQPTAMNIRLVELGVAPQWCKNLAKSCFREETGSSIQRFLANYWMFQMVTLITCSSNGNWHSSSIFCRQILWTWSLFPLYDGWIST